MRAGLLWLIVICTYLSYSQCNTDVTICTAGVAGPFSFTTSAGPPIDYATPVACNTGVNPPNYQFSFISLYITTGGPLNLLIDGDATTGYLDVVVYRIPTGIPPCLAVMDNNNEIGCK